MSNEPPCLHETGLNVLWLQPGVAFENGFNAVASRLPLVIGFPPNILGLTMVRSNNLSSSIISSR